MQTALLFAIHSVAITFIADIDKCSSFFDFSLLLLQTYPYNTETFTGNAVKIPRPLRLTAALTVNLFAPYQYHNQCGFAGLLSRHAKCVKNGKRIEVNPGRSRNLELTELGSEDSTFLVVKRLGKLNDITHLLEIKD